MWNEPETNITITSVRSQRRANPRLAWGSRRRAIGKPQGGSGGRLASLFGGWPRTRRNGRRTTGGRLRCGGVSSTETPDVQGRDGAPGGGGVRGWGARLTWSPRRSSRGGRLRLGGRGGAGRGTPLRRPTPSYYLCVADGRRPINYRHTDNLLFIARIFARSLRRCAGPIRRPRGPVAAVGDACRRSRLRKTRGRHFSHYSK